MAAAAVSVSGPTAGDLVRLIDSVVVPGKDSSVRSNVEKLYKVLLSQRATFETQIVNAIAKSVVGQPEQVGVYATLIGLVNAVDFDFGDLIVRKLHAQLREALESCDVFTAKLITRCLADLVNASVLRPDAVANLFLTLLSACKEESSPQPRTDAYVEIVLASLPWVARDLDDRLTRELEDMLATVEAYMSKRSTGHVDFLRVVTFPSFLPQEDFLATLWMQIKNLRARSWRETIIPRLYIRFNEVLVNSMQHGLPDLELLRTPGLVYPVPRVNFRLFDEFDTPQDPRILAPYSFSRAVLEAFVGDVIGAGQKNHLVAASHLANLIDDFHTEPVAYVIVEMFLGELLRLPSSVVAPFYLNVLMCELVQCHPSVLPVLVLALSHLYTHVCQLDVECFTRLVDWLAHLLSFFDAEFAWSLYSDAPTLPEGDAHLHFVRELLLRTARLSPHSQLRKVLPRSLDPLLPPLPDWRGEPMQGADAMEQTILAVAKQDRPDATFSAAVARLAAPGFTADAPESDLYRVDMLMHCVLRGGAQTLSHSIALLEICKHPLRALLVTPDRQARAIHSLFDGWADHPQMVVIMAEQMLRLEVAPASAIITYLFRDHFNDTAARLFRWEVLFNTIDVMCALVDQLGRKAEKEPEGTYRSSLQAQYVAAQETHATTLMLLFDLFTKTLSRYLDRAAQDPLGHEGRWWHVVSGRLRQALRKYYPRLSQHGLLMRLRTAVFGRLDERLHFVDRTLDSLAGIM